MTDFRQTLDNSHYIRKVLTLVMRIIMRHPYLKADFIKVIEAGVVLCKWYEDLQPHRPEIVNDVLTKPKREWREQWCKPDNWKGREPERKEGMTLTEEQRTSYLEEFALMTDRALRLGHAMCVSQIADLRSEIDNVIWKRDKIMTEYNKRPVKEKGQTGRAIEE